MSSRKNISRESNISFGRTQATYETANFKKGNAAGTTNGETWSQDVEVKRTNIFTKKIQGEELKWSNYCPLPQMYFLQAFTTCHYQTLTAHHGCLHILRQHS